MMNILEREISDIRTREQRRKDSCFLILIGPFTQVVTRDEANKDRDKLPRTITFFVPPCSYSIRRDSD